MTSVSTRRSLVTTTGWLTPTVVVSIATGDGVPLSPPFKVSAISGHDHATLTINVTGAGPVRAYKLKRGGSAITNGVQLATLGAICGMAVCGADEPTAIPTPAVFTEDVAFADFGGGADGDYPMNLYVYNGALYE